MAERTGMLNPNVNRYPRLSPLAGWTDASLCEQ
jgi:hypothetical protein